MNTFKKEDKEFLEKLAELNGLTIELYVLNQDFGKRIKVKCGTNIRNMKLLKEKVRTNLTK